MKNNVFNILDLVRTKYIKVAKMIPIGQIDRQLVQPMKTLVKLSWGKTTGLGYRMKLVYRFLEVVYKMDKFHGSVATVKWLKAVTVSLQKELGQDRVTSLRIFEPDMPLPRLTNGLPRVIPVLDRALIRKGDPRCIRFWHGLFSLYRVLQIPGVIKLQTITAEFIGNTTSLGEVIGLTASPQSFFHFFMKGLKIDLVPRKFEVSRKSSPSNKLAAAGILTDLFDLFNKEGEVGANIKAYLSTVSGTNKRAYSAFMEKLENGLHLSQRLHALNGTEIIGKSGAKYVQHDYLPTKSAVRNHGFPGKGEPIFGQFAIKREAAGKIRVFALLDPISQSVLRPIHDLLFSILRRIPNDGTFNQEESIRRSMVKAQKAGKAFSFDLTAATDRLPVALTAYIIEQLVSVPGFGRAWSNLMVDRDFFLNEEVARKVKTSPGPYRYAVGQPMGGLSSWPGLAITHHWIMQLAARNVYGNNIGWYDNYEVLGDDIVIFDELVAHEYLRLMSLLGCEINLSKSIVSKARPVFEFAKRTCWGDSIVSGVSLAQLQAGWSVGSRVANALQLSSTGLITSVGLLQTVLSRYASLKLDNKNLGLGVMATLGSLLSKKDSGVTLELLMHAIFDPLKPDFEYKGEAVGLPLAASLNALLAFLNGETPAYPFSKREARQELFKEYRSEISAEILDKAMEIAQRLYEEDPHIDGARKLWVAPYNLADFTKSQNLTYVINDMPDSIKLLFIQVEGYFFNDILNMEFEKENPESFYEELEAALYKHAKGFYFSFEEALEFLNRAEALEFKLTLNEPKAPGKTVIETSPILGIVRRMMNWEGKITHPRRSYVLNFRSAY